MRLEEGTTILGDTSTDGLLPIGRGAQIIAVGTETHPVVFTSEEPVGQRSQGDRGGLILLGRAGVNVAGGEPFVECLPDARSGGGRQSVPGDSSGRFRFVRVEYAAAEICPDSPLAAITLAAVGAGTVIDRVQCKFALEDGIEVFGGSVDLKQCLVGSVNDD